MAMGLRLLPRRLHLFGRVELRAVAPRDRSVNVSVQLLGRDS